MVMLKTSFAPPMFCAVCIGLLAAISHAPAGAQAQSATVVDRASEARAAVAAAEPAAWPQWRGPGRTGILPGKFPTQLKDGALQKLWRVELPPGYSGPVVAGDAVFVAGTENQKREVVRALDRKTGEQLWETSWAGSLSVPFFAASNGSWIRATPAYDNGRLYVAGMRDRLTCLNAQDGKEVWTVDFPKQVGTAAPSFGYVSSPLVDGNAVYTQAGGAVVKLDKLTGKIIWRKLKDGGGMSGSAFSSPIIAEVAGKRQLIVQTRTTLAGMNLEDGNVLWSRKIPAFRGMNILTPVVYRDSIFTSTYGGKSLLVDISSQGGRLSASEKWVNKTQGYMSTPVVIDGHAYLHRKDQRVSCIDLSNGELKWTSRPFGKYWSMVARGNTILALDEKGYLYLLAADPAAFKLLDSRNISDAPTWAHLAVAGDTLFVRELNAVAAYRHVGK